jgi:hypothetical protein
MFARVTAMAGTCGAEDGGDGRSRALATGASGGIGAERRAALSAGGRDGDRRPKVDPQLTDILMLCLGRSRTRWPKCRRTGL